MSVNYFSAPENVPPLGTCQPVLCSKYGGPIKSLTIRVSFSEIEVDFTALVSSSSHSQLFYSIDNKYTTLSFGGVYKKKKKCN